MTWRDLIWETDASRVMDPEWFELETDGYMGTVSYNKSEVFWDGQLVVANGGVTFNAGPSVWRFQGQPRKKSPTLASWHAPFKNITGFGIQEGKKGFLNALRNQGKELLKIELADGTTELFVLKTPSLDSAVALFNHLLEEVTSADEREFIEGIEVTSQMEDQLADIGDAIQHIQPPASTAHTEWDDTDVRFDADHFDKEQIDGLREDVERLYPDVFATAPASATILVVKDESESDMVLLQAGDETLFTSGQYLATDIVDGFVELAQYLHRNPVTTTRKESP